MDVKTNYNQITHFTKILYKTMTTIKTSMHLSKVPLWSYNYNLSLNVNNKLRKWKISTRLYDFTVFSNKTRSVVRARQALNDFSNVSVLNMLSVLWLKHLTTQVLARSKFLNSSNSYLIVQWINRVRQESW